MPEAMSRILSSSSPSTWIAVLAALFFLAMGMRAVIAPVGSSAFFGVGVHSGPGLAFVRTTGARNIAIALTALALVATDAKLGLAVLLLASALVAAIDAYAVATHAGFEKSRKHIAYMALLFGFGCWIGIQALAK